MLALSVLSKQWKMSEKKLEIKNCVVKMLGFLYSKYSIVDFTFQLNYIVHY